MTNSPDSPDSDLPVIDLPAIDGPTDRLGVAIAGTGFGQKIHLPALQLHHRTQPVAIYHRDRTQAEAIAAQHAIPLAESDFGALVARPEVQAVALSTPPFLHFEMAQQVLAAGKHLLLEKPVTLDVAEAIALQRLAEQTGAIVAVDFEFRYVPAWQHLAARLAAGELGRLRLVKVDWLGASRAEASRPWNWYAQQACGGGVLGAIGSHTFDYLAWLLEAITGPVARLSAHLTTSISERPDPATGQLKPVDSEDVATLLLEFADGTPAQVCLASTTYQGRGHWVELYGDRGTLILGSNHPSDYVHGFELRGSQGGAPLAVLLLPPELDFPAVYPDGRLAPVLRVVDAWVQGIDQGRPVAPSLQEGIASQRLMDLARQSHQERRWLEVAP